jgi:hypothetical protein
LDPKIPKGAQRLWFGLKYLPLDCVRCISMSETVRSLPRIYHNGAQVLTRAQRTRVHFCSQHWLLCHLGLYSFEFEFDIGGLKMFFCMLRPVLARDSPSWEARATLVILRVKFLVLTAPFSSKFCCFEASPALPFGKFTKISISRPYRRV